MAQCSKDNPDPLDIQTAEEEVLDSFVAREQLPLSYKETARLWFFPLAAQIAAEQRRGDLRVLGITGTQGSGKSTLAGLLEALLSKVHGLRTVAVSMDDFYLTRAERQRLGEELHPLLATRGVPGTHDIGLAMNTIKSLLEDGEEDEVAVPRFDKARDDRKPTEDWPRLQSPVDLVILEGWCLRARPQSEAELSEPINDLEAQEDSDARWRHYVNDQLQQHYPALFALIDKLVALQAPDFSCVYHWRSRQEKKLTATGPQVMSEAQLQRFVQFFERITRACLRELPESADVVFALNEEQQIVGRSDG